MGTDDLFPTDDTPTEPETPSETPKSTEPSGAAQLAEVLSNINAGVQSIHQRVGALEQNATKPVAPAETPADPKDPYHALYTEPDAYIDSRVKKGVKEAVEPFVETTTRNLVAANMERTKAMVSEQLGDKVWDEIVNPALNQMAQTRALDPRTLVDQNAAQALVSGIIGIAMQDPAKRQQLFKGSQEASRRREPPVMMTGVGVRPKSPERLDPEERKFVEKLQQSGLKDWTGERYLKARNRGRTESDWKPAAKGASA